MAVADRDRQPLYRQVAGEIRKEIKTGVWSPGEKLPSEPELAQRYAVSRATVRESLRVLEQDGVVRASRGHGTFVRPAEVIPHVGINTLYSICETISRQGYTPSTTDVSITRGDLKDAFCAPFPTQPRSEMPALPHDEPVAIIDRTRRADGWPVAYTRDAVPLRLLENPGWEERVASGSLFDLLRERDAEVDYTYTRIFAVEAPKEVAQRLELKPGAPLLMMEETVYDKAGVPLLASRDFYRTDRIEVMVVRTRTGRARDSGDSTWVR